MKFSLLEAAFAEVPTRQEFMHMDAWQKGLFYALMAASVAALAAQITARWRLWRKGKPISWRANWWANVRRYVLGQRKVQTSRPRSGAPMHLLIFYGFLSLLLATTLLGINTYSPVKFHKGTYYLIYEMTFDLLGLLLFVGLAWAMGRRWLRRPLVVSHAVSDSWALILLMSLVLTGYGLEAARMSNNPQPWDWSAPVGFALSRALPTVSNGGYVGIWWFHAVLVAVFIVTLPRMRLRHVVMAVLSAAGSPERSMGRLEPITLEEVEATGKIGVSEAADYSRWHLMSLDACMECGRCTEVCPANGVGKVLDPKQIALGVRLAASSGGSVADTVSEEALWQCTTCNACVEACPVLIRHVDLIVDARRGLVADGKLSGSAATMLRQVGSTGSAWGASAEQREDWMKGLDVPLCRDGAAFDVLLWVGCAGATDPGAVKTTRAVAQLLAKAGVRFACLGREEACTGDPARRVGDEFTFQERAQTNASAFERYGVQHVVTPCPHCFNTFKHEYGDFGAAVRVEHHTQLLARLVSEGKLEAASAAPGSITVHDPCYLGRVNNEADAPRGMFGIRTNMNDERTPLERIADPVQPANGSPIAEVERRGRKTLCCGAGGGRMWMEEPPTERPANRRVEELVATGADTIAVGCPFCRIMLDTGLQRDEAPPRLADLAELLLEANS